MTSDKGWLSKPAERAAGQICSMLDATKYVMEVWSEHVTPELVTQELIPKWAAFIEQEPQHAADRIIEDLFSRRQEFRLAWEKLGGRGCPREVILRNLVIEYETGHFG